MCGGDKWQNRKRNQCFNWSVLGKGFNGKAHLNTLVPMGASCNAKGGLHLPVFAFLELISWAFTLKVQSYCKGIVKRYCFPGWTFTSTFHFRVFCCKRHSQSLCVEQERPGFHFQLQQLIYRSFLILPPTNSYVQLLFVQEDKDSLPCLVWFSLVHNVFSSRSTCSLFPSHCSDNTCESPAIFFKRGKCQVNIIIFV